MFRPEVLITSAVLGSAPPNLRENPKGKKTATFLKTVIEQYLSKFLTRVGTARHTLFSARLYISCACFLFSNYMGIEIYNITG